MNADVLIIGWGKAGKTLAGKLKALGKDVVLVERSQFMYGGTCINVACVPTKDLVTSADQKRPTDDPASYFERAVASRDELISALNSANYSMLREAGVTLFDGHARFTGPKTVSIETVGGQQSATAETVIVGTGTTPRVPDLPGATLPGVHDSTTLQHVTPLPQRLTIIGAGFIGVEFASMFAGFGSQVTLLDSGDVFMPRLDRDVADALHTTLADRGARIVSGAVAHKIVQAEETLTVRTSAGDFTADAVLMAVGRVPATEDLGLDAAGITTDEKGFIAVDEKLRTSVPGVYAVGDVNGGPQFTYISYDDHRIVMDQLTGSGERSRADRVAVPSTTFTTPPLSTVGLSETEAVEAGYRVAVASKPVAAIATMPRPKIVGQTHGLLKFVVDADTDLILGATLFCIDSQELVNLVALAMRAKVSYTLLRDGIWTHPSSTEAFNEVLSELKPARPQRQ